MNVNQATKEPKMRTVAGGAAALAVADPLAEPALLAEIAEEAQHHPDITIRHTKVTLKLTTHDAGGVTELDIELAQRVDNLVD